MADHKEEQLLEALSRVLLANTLHGVVLFSQDGPCLWANGMAADIAGISAAEIVKHGLSDSLWGEGLEEDAKQAIATGEPVLREVKHSRSKQERWIERVISPVDIQGSMCPVMLVEDRTEDKEAQASLEEEITRRRILVEQSRDGISVLDETGAVVEANEEFARMLGYTLEEVYQLHIWDWDGLHDKEELLEILRVVGVEGDHFETTHRRKDGMPVEVELSTNAAFLGDKKLVFCISRDVTERKKLEERLQQEVARRAILVEQSRDGIVVIDSDGAVVEANDEYARMLGYTLEEAHQLHIWDWNSDWTKEALLELLRDPNNVGSRLETRHRRKDGTFVNIEIVSNAAFIGEKKLHFCVCRDMTERAQMEEALRQGEQMQRAILEAVRTGIVIIDAETHTVVSANETSAEMIGLPAAEIVGRVCHQHICPAEEGKCPVTDLGQTVDNSERVLLRADGTRLPIMKTAVPLVVDGRPCLLESFIDISRLKEAEQSLRLTKFSLDHAGGQVFWIDTDGRIVDVTDSTCEALGYTREEMVGMTIGDLDPSLPKDYAQSEAFRRGWETLKAKGSTVHEGVHRRKDGRLIPVEVSANFVEWEGKEYDFVYASDITQRKRLEKKFRLTQYSVDHAAGQVFWIGPDGILTYASASTCEALGYTRDEMLCMSIYDIDPSAPRPWDDLWKTLKTAGARTFETTHRTKDGVFIPVEINSNFVEYEGHEYSFVSAQDITERKRMEESLRLTQLSVDRAGDMVFWTGPDGALISVNDSMCRQMGYTREELLDKTIFDVDPKAPQPWSKHWESLKQQGNMTFESVHRTKTGKTIPVEVTASHVEFDGKEYNLAFSRDITQRKRMEKKFRLTQYSVDHASGQIFWVGPDGILTYASESTCKALGYTRDEMLCMSIYDIDPDAPRPWSDHWKELKEAGSFTFETTHRTKEGSRSLWRSTPTSWSTKATSTTSSSRRDISNRKRAGAVAGSDPDVGEPGRRADLLGRA